MRPAHHSLAPPRLFVPSAHPSHRHTRAASSAPGAPRRLRAAARLTARPRPPSLPVRSRRHRRVDALRVGAPKGRHQRGARCVPTCVPSRARAGPGPFPHTQHSPPPSPGVALLQIVLGCRYRPVRMPRSPCALICSALAPCPFPARSPPHLALPPSALPASGGDRRALREPAQPAALRRRGGGSYYHLNNIILLILSYHIIYRHLYYCYHVAERRCAAPPPPPYLNHSFPLLRFFCALPPFPPAPVCPGCEQSAACARSPQRALRCGFGTGAGVAGPGIWELPEPAGGSGGSGGRRGGGVGPLRGHWEGRKGPRQGAARRMQRCSPPPRRRRQICAALC